MTLNVQPVIVENVCFPSRSGARDRVFLPGVGRDGERHGAGHRVDGSRDV